MSQFWKSPRFWVAVVLVGWFSYLLSVNLPERVQLYIVPHFFHPTISLSLVIGSSIVVGCILTLLLQFMWRRRASRRSSNHASVSAAAPAPPESSKTVA
jgi:hypothetical protein